MDRDEILEKIAGKVKKEGQVYMPPAINEDAPEYIGSFYSRIKSKQSFAYSMLSNKGCRIILEEEPHPDDSRKISLRQITIANENDAEAGKVSAERVYVGFGTWLIIEQLKNRNVTDGFKSIDEFLASLC